jgi:hypothetical protein
MWWLWIAGPIAVACIYLLTGAPDKHRAREVELWRASWGPERVPVPPKKGKKGASAPVQSGARRVPGLPADLARLAIGGGAGEPIGIFELVPRIAFLAVYGPSATAGSDVQMVLGKLASPAPPFTARPVPIVDGTRVPNTGILFTKDAPFSAAYLVEGTDARGIKKWLNPLVREQLLDMPELWLDVEGKALAVMVYGPADAEKLDDLVAAADVIFAEYGAEGGPSLLGDDSELRTEDTELSPEAPEVVAKAKKASKSKAATKSKGA